MKNFKLLILITTILLLTTCSKDDANEPSSIEIGNYKFNFQSTFTLEEYQGIDSYAGKINGSEISLSFDYGWYTRPAENLPVDEYLVTEKELNGHYRQIVKPLNSEANFTRIHLFKISDSIENPHGYNSLTISTNNLNTIEQKMIIAVFSNVEIIE